jgi:mono/diheme cytochrome c family protein
MIKQHISNKGPSDMLTLQSNFCFSASSEVFKRLAYMSALCLLVIGQGAMAASAEKGRENFMKNGCWQCHGTWGQGGAAGLRLAPNPKPLAYISAFIRNSNGPMPPYTTKVLSEEDLGDIYAYLQSIPASPEAKNIPLLNDLK